MAMFSVGSAGSPRRGVAVMLLNCPAKWVVGIKICKDVFKKGFIHQAYFIDVVETSLEWGISVVKIVTSSHAPLVASGTSMFLTTKQGVSERISSIRQQSAAKMRYNILLTWMPCIDALQHYLCDSVSSLS